MNLQYSVSTRSYRAQFKKIAQVAIAWWRQIATETNIPSYLLGSLAKLIKHTSALAVQQDYQNILSYLLGQNSDEVQQFYRV